MKKRIMGLLLAISMIVSPITAQAKTVNHLTKSGGVYWNEAGFRETYYNLNMKTCVKYMRQLGYSEEEYPYTVTEDGIKKLGDYVMVAAHLKYYPKGTIVTTSWGDGIVVDTGTGLKSYSLDLCVTW